MMTTTLASKLRTKSVDTTRKELKKCSLNDVALIEASLENIVENDELESILTQYVKKSDMNEYIHGDSTIVQTGLTEKDLSTLTVPIATTGNLSIDGPTASFVSAIATGVKASRLSARSLTASGLSTAELTAGSPDSILLGEKTLQEYFDDIDVGLTEKDLSTLTVPIATTTTLTVGGTATTYNITVANNANVNNLNATALTSTIQYSTTLSAADLSTSKLSAVNLSTTNVSANSLSATRLSANSLSATNISANSLSTTRLSANTLTATSISTQDLTSQKHGLVGKDIDFSTGGDEVLAVGHDHKIYGKESFVAGNEGNLIGAKAFHWKAIDTTSSLIYLTHEQTTFNASNIPSSKITEVGAGNYVSQSSHKKYDIPYFGPRSESYYSDDNLFKADDQISILKDDVYSGNPPKLVQKGAVGKTLILNNVQNLPYFRKLVVEDVLSGSVLSVSGLDTIEPSYQQTHYRKNKDHTYHGNYYFVCFQDVPDISTYIDGGWEKNMTFGCAALGENNCTIGYNSFAIGKDNTTEGNYSIALGYNAKAGNNSVFAWSGGGAYNVSGEGQFGINPKGGIQGFYIGNKSLDKYIGDPQYMLDKRDGGVVSGNVEVLQHDMKILSGNYIQTNDDGLSVQNFSYKNAFLQAEYVNDHPEWGIACTGSKGYCILSVNPTAQTIKLSGDISKLNGNTSKKYSWSFGSKGGSQDIELQTVNASISTVTLKNGVPNDLIEQTSSLTNETQYINKFNNDDNAFYCPSMPDIGNTVIHNFYANHAEGGSVKAIGKYAHAEGRGSIADMRYSHAEGDRTVAGKMAAHSEGQCTSAIGHYSHAEGFYTLVSSDAVAGHSEGMNTIAAGQATHAEGLSTKAIGYITHAEGYNSVAGFAYDLIDEDTGEVKLHHAESAWGNQCSHAEGQQTSAIGRWSHSEGYGTFAGVPQQFERKIRKQQDEDGTNNQGLDVAGHPDYFLDMAVHAEGYQTSAFYKGSHAEGLLTKATGNETHAEGYQTIAGVDPSQISTIANFDPKDYATAHAEGYQTSALAKGAHTEGGWTKALGNYSYAGGLYATAKSKYQFVWSGVNSSSSRYEPDTGEGSFCIKPKNGINGFYINDKNFINCVLSALQTVPTNLKTQFKNALTALINS